MTFTQFKDQVVLVTGGSMGIGKELARQLVHAGAVVVITGRNETRLNEVQVELGQDHTRFLAIVSDISQVDQQQVLIDRILSEFGRIDYVLLNAAMSAFGELDTTSDEVIHEMLTINLTGQILFTKKLIPHLKQSKGGVLFVSSIASFYGMPEYSLYALTKKAIATFAESLRIELSRFDVFVGVAYLSFTENEQQKRTLNPNGELESVPQRSKLLVNSREKTASLLLKQVVRRKRVVTHSVFGKVVYNLSALKAFMHVMQSRLYAKKMQA